MTKVDLTQYSTRAGLPDGYSYDRGLGWRILWHYVSAIVFQSQLFPIYGLKVKLLRLFGAKIGNDVLIKPGVTIKYPWHLEVDDHVWIGEGAWMDCTGLIRIGSHVIVSQGAFLCSGSHDFNDPGMGSITRPIVVEDGVWICAFARIVLGITIGEDAILLMGAVVLRDCDPSGIYQGHPAEKIGERKIRDYPGPKRSSLESAEAAR